MRCAADLRRTQRRPSSPRRVPRGPLQSTPHRPPRQLIPHERGVCPGPGSPAARPGRGSCSRAPRAALTAPPRQIPIGLAGSGSPSAGDVLGSSALGGARSVARGAADASLALPLGSSPVPRVWPMVADALRRAAGTPARAPAAATAGPAPAPRLATRWQVVRCFIWLHRFSVSLHPPHCLYSRFRGKEALFRALLHPVRDAACCADHGSAQDSLGARVLRCQVEVIDEDIHFYQSVSVHRERRVAGDPHPDLRPGLMRTDIPRAYIAELDYGHRLIVTANISQAFDPGAPACSVGGRAPPPHQGGGALSPPRGLRPRAPRRGGLRALPLGPRAAPPGRGDRGDAGKLPRRRPLPPY